ncbi:hypothetical protein IB024_06875 [Brucella sp. 6810]|uniref:hypothetical protein n=1 Tax=Brucella sp. 6810 TaxID=2769351 RepID=UPI00165A22D2|nr:hypothetical protein [Brucella sp. 6810]QNQ61406.1 hypothetical protein IB024_06875 [Brucella sp. 6810]
MNLLIVKSELDIASGYWEKEELKMTRMIMTFGWAVLTLSSALLAFKINLNSDSLFLDAVMVDVFGRGGAWSDWKITPAPAYFPDMLVYAVGYYLIPTPALRITFVSVVQALLLAFVCINFAKTIQPLHSRLQSLIVLILISIFALVAANSSMWLFFNSTNNHFAALLFPLLVGWMVFRYWDYKKLSSIFWIILCVFAGAASTPVFLLSFTIPFLIFAFLAAVIFRQEKAIRNFFIKVVFYVFVGHIIASFFNSVVLPHDTFGERVPVTIDAAKISLGHFFEATKITFSRENSFTFALSFFSLTAIVAIFLDFLIGLNFSIGRGNERLCPYVAFKIPATNVRYFSVFTFFSIAFPVCVLGSVASGGFVDQWGYRYFALPIALGLLLFAVKFDEVMNKYFALKKSIFYLVVTTLFLAIAAVGLISASKMLSNSGRESVAYLLDKGIRNPSDDIADCIRREERNGFGFKAGVADFWDSRGVIYKAENIPFILPVTNDLRPFFHMMSLGPLLNPKKYNVPSYNFLIAKKSGTITQFNMTPESLGKLLPTPTKIVDCENSNSSLWLYNNLELDDVIRNNITYFLGSLGELQSFSMPGSSFPGQVGKIESVSRVANSNTDGSGFLAYGPYVKMPRGKYKASISYEATDNGNRWDAGRFNDPARNVAIAGGYLPAGRGEVNFEFELEKPLEQFEIRIWFDGYGSIKLEKISIEPKVH